MSTFIDTKTGVELEADTTSNSSENDDVISLITIIDNEIIHNKSLYSFPPDEERKMKFGIIKINTDVLPKVNKVLFFLFSVDCSGSMSDLCNDMRTKNDHIIHTLTNMLLFFSEKENISIYVQIDAFDDAIVSIIPFVLVSKANVGKLINQLKKIYPRNSTNIELALNNASTQIENAASVETLSCAEKYHIFMTDGDITQGNSCEKHLKTLLNPKATNIFIGFGINHNIKVLSELGGGNDHSSSVNNYYFIDELENSGLVYGEIIHNILYASLKQVTLFVVNGLIYNWKTNTWTNTLNIGNVIFSSEKVYHIVSFVQDDSSADSGANACHNAGANADASDDDMKIAIDITIDIDMANNSETYTSTIISASGNIDNEPFCYTQYTCDPDPSLSELITKYKYRQRTQQLLFLARHFDDYKNKDVMKQKMDDFFNELKTCNVDDKPFMKLLMDDIYITRKMFETPYNSLYSNARQTSQGTQRCYNVGNYSADITETTTTVGMNTMSMPMPMPMISRQTTQHITQQSPTSTQPYNNLYEKYYGGEKDGEKDENNTLLDGYEMSQNTDTPYSNPTLLGIMREISAPPPTPAPTPAHTPAPAQQLRYFFQDDDYLK